MRVTSASDFMLQRYTREYADNAPFERRLLFDVDAAAPPFAPDSVIERALRAPLDARVLIRFRYARSFAMPIFFFFFFLMPAWLPLVRLRSDACSSIYERKPADVEICHGADVTPRNDADQDYVDAKIRHQTMPRAPRCRACRYDDMPPTCHAACDIFAMPDHR